MTAYGQRKLLVIELNEFNPELLSRASEHLSLRNIGQMLALAHASTDTDDRVEHHGLDPWVQWVGIHSGVPTAVHEVLRLGMTRGQTHKQIWHLVADLGYSWGVWGAMNAPLGDARGCAFFMPDPWSFDEAAAPAELNDLLALPRYVSKNYLDVNKWQAFRCGLRFARYFMHRDSVGILPAFLRKAVPAIAKAGLNVHTMTTLLDYLSVLVFVRLRERLHPNLSIIFLNHLAHLQHQFWKSGERFHPQMELGLRLCDEMLGMLFASADSGERTLVINGLKQINVAGTGQFGYRQRNPESALEALGVPTARVEQCMTHDAHVRFECEADADKGESVLRSATLSDGRRAFHVERIDACSIFYQFDFDVEVAADARVVAGDRSNRFFDLFEIVGERTGAHIPSGDVFTNLAGVPDTLRNHEIFDVIRDYFEGVGAKTKVPTYAESSLPSPLMRQRTL